MPTNLKQPKYILNVIRPGNFKSLNINKTLQRAYSNAFEVVEAKNVTQLAMPLLFTGLSEISQEMSAKALISTLKEFLDYHEASSLKTIHLVNIDHMSTIQLLKIIEKVLINEMPSSIISCSLCRQRIRRHLKLKCNHVYCLGCQLDLKDKNVCLVENCDKSESSKQIEINTEKLETDVKIPQVESDKECEICSETFNLNKFIQLPNCQHDLCTACYQKILASNPKCPFCQTFFGKPKGNQPNNGKMIHQIISSCLAGYPNTQTIEITYSFPSGTQNKNHPRPGKSYAGITRTAYLPKTVEGLELLNLLQEAFRCSLTFTIGTSTSSGVEGITWNDIHHKTQFIGPYI